MGSYGFRYFKTGMLAAKVAAIHKNKRNFLQISSMNCGSSGCFSGVFRRRGGGIVCETQKWRINPVALK